MSRSSESSQYSWLTRRRAVMICALAGVVMGLPTLGGRFVGGDDHRLVRNHLFVNHPSVDHAIKLFGIVHRDLYQPLPLLSFQMEFAVAGALGLFDVDPGPVALGAEAVIQAVLTPFGETVTRGAWLFHFTNILLHALNVVLVWFVVRMLQQRCHEGDLEDPEPAVSGVESRLVVDDSEIVATVAALFYAMHPIQTEVVAWTNGRMLLMSTLFASLSLLSFGSWLDRRRGWLAVLTVLFLLLSGISKVRIGLPILMGIVVLARRVKVRPRVVALWSVCSVLMAVLVLVNVKATTGAALFSTAAEYLHGPRLVRVILALGNYFEHLVWPVGLSSYYPAPAMVAWSDGTTWRALLVTLLSLGIMAWFARRHRVMRLGVLWFFGTLASTLPFLPARNVLAADRYMYLPIIGLLWAFSSIGLSAYRRLSAALPAGYLRAAVMTLAVGLFSFYVGMSWHVGRFYANPVRKTLRIANINPTTPRVWERAGWAFHKIGRYDDAVACAQKELVHEAANLRSRAYQLLGTCELHRRGGSAETALDLLRKAIEVDPEDSLARYRLAAALDELGRYAQSVPYFEAAIAGAPGQNPTILRLAKVYRRLGRANDARVLYENALVNNPYDVPAVMGLVELDILDGTHEARVRAEERLRAILKSVPDSPIALTNLGAVLVGLGRQDEAIGFYTSALRYDPKNVTARVNLAQVYRTRNDPGRASELFGQAIALGLESVDQAVSVHDYLVLQEAWGHMRRLWDDMVKRFPGSKRARAFSGWTSVLAGRVGEARTRATAQLRMRNAHPLAFATQGLVLLLDKKYYLACVQARAMEGSGPDSVDARRRFLSALERFDRQRPGVAWTFCAAAEVLIADGQMEGARMSVELCRDRCSDDRCPHYVQDLESRLTSDSQIQGTP